METSYPNVPPLNEALAALLLVDKSCFLSCSVTERHWNVLTKYIFGYLDKIFQLAANNLGVLGISLALLQPHVPPIPLRVSF